MLYNALTGCAYGLDAHVELLELDKMLFDERRTDIAFLLNGRLIVLIEHQSTKNPTNKGAAKPRFRRVFCGENSEINFNMPLRCL
ncbi:MAG: hypothetical protein LBS62_02585, partial [Clostridiales bacterium]|nr:hypothetical protein [Clostridiales bacterium]